MTHEASISRRQFLATTATGAAAAFVLGDESLARREAFALRPTLSGIPTGFRQIDQVTGGLHCRELAIVAARPGAGTTSLALNVSDHVTVEASIPALYCSFGTRTVQCQPPELTC